MLNNSNDAMQKQQSLRHNPLPLAHTKKEWEDQKNTVIPQAETFHPCHLANPTKRLQSIARQQDF